MSSCDFAKSASPRKSYKQASQVWAPAEQALTTRKRSRNDFLRNPRFSPPNTLHGGKSLIFASKKPVPARDMESKQLEWRCDSPKVTPGRPWGWSGFRGSSRAFWGEAGVGLWDPLRVLDSCFAALANVLRKSTWGLVLSLHLSGLGQPAGGPRSHLPLSSDSRVLKSTVFKVGLVADTWWLSVFNSLPTEGDRCPQGLPCWSVITQ